MSEIISTDFLKLNKQQQEIIDSNEQRIIVKAGPGSGKTYTIVKRIEKELTCIEDYKNIIACSFSKEASKQLERKLKSKIDVKESFIGTIDSLILVEFITPYKNRIRKYFKEEKNNEKLIIRMPQRDSIANILTKQGRCVNNKNQISEYKKNWKNNFINNIYEISFPTYLLAKYILKNIPLIKKNISEKYSTIYIDEAQDLNSFQHEFLKALIKYCNLKCVLIGDANQSIYEFRGAKPALFLNLTNEGFAEYNISVSVRCHQSILDFSNRIINDSQEIYTKEDYKVYLNSKPTIKALKNNKEVKLILCETNNHAALLYEYYLEKKIRVIYSRAIQIIDIRFKENYIDIVEEIISFYLNFENKNSKFVYSLEDFKLFLSNYILESDINDDLIEPNENIIEYIKKILFKMGINISPDVEKNLCDQLCMDIVINHYLKVFNVDRIMTIHASKGLEADEVYVILENLPKKFDDEYRRKLFVASTRAKNKLHISYKKNSNIENSELDIFLKKILQ